MIFIAEATLAMSLVCNAPRRRDGERPFQISHVSDKGKDEIPFQISSGSSLENQVMVDLKDIPGVMSVKLTGSAPDYAVNVIIEAMDFSIVEKVAEKEIRLVDEYPNLKFHFDIEPWMDEGAHDESLHAA